MSQKTLYERLGGYDAICAVANDLLRACKAMSDWDVTGNTGERMASNGRSSS